TRPRDSHRSWANGAKSWSRRAPWPCPDHSKACSVADDDFRADGSARIEVDDVAIGETETSRRHRFADRLGLVGAVNAVNRAAEIHGTGAHRVPGTSGHEARQIGLPRDHLGRGRPIRPFRLANYSHEAGPLKALAADAD